MMSREQSRFISHFCRVWKESSSTAEVAEKLVLSKDTVLRRAKQMRELGHVLHPYRPVQVEITHAIPADRVCIYAPGSKEKIAELQRRASLGMEIHHPLDANAGNAVNKMPISKPINPRSKTRFVVQ